MLRAIMSLAMKDLKLLVRDRAGFFFVIGFPAIFALFFGSIFSDMGSGGGGSAIRIVVFDADQSEASAEFVDSLASGGEFEVSIAEDAETARSMVRRGQRAAFLILEEGFGEKSESIFTGDPPELTLGTDPSRGAEAAMVEGLVTKHAFERLQEVFSDPAKGKANVDTALDSLDSGDASPQVKGVLGPFLSSTRTFFDQLPTIQDDVDGDEGDGQAGVGFGFTPVEIETESVIGERPEGIPPSSWAFAFPQATSWALIATAAGFGVSLVVERTRGTLTRLRVAPIPAWAALAGKGLACFLATAIVSAALLGFGIAVFGIRPLSYVALLGAIVSASLCFVGLMMLLASLGRTEQSAGAIGWAVLLVFAMLGGAMAPLFVMPDWMRAASVVSPVRWAIVAIEHAVWRGASFGEMWLPCALLVAIGAACFGGGALRFRFES